MINITTIKLGNMIEDVKCPRCKQRMFKLVGIYSKSEKSHELECQSCFYSEKVNPKEKEINFSYEEPKKKKEKKEDNEDE
jgi:transposase-like protein